MRIILVEELDLRSARLKSRLRRLLGEVVAWFVFFTTIPPRADEFQWLLVHASLVSERQKNPSPHDSPQESPQAAPRSDESPRRVFNDRITPHWFHDNTRFWYRNDLRDGAKEFILVDAEHGTRETAFDHAKLAAALSRVGGVEYRAERLPFDSIEFIEDSKAIRFSVGEVIWKCDLTTLECVKTDVKASAAPAGETAEDTSAAAGRRP